MADFSQLIADVQAVIRENGRQLITGPVLQSSLIEIINTINADKQDTISDLDDIRDGAAAGATAYQLPEGGIPYADLDEEVQEKLDLAQTAYQKPGAGIPFEDLEHSVQVFLEKADNSLQPYSDYDGQIPVYNEDGYIQGSGITPADVYQLPEGGIPLEDLDEEVQIDLLRAHDALVPGDVKNELGGGTDTPIAQDIVTETFSQQRELIDGKADAEGLAKDLTAGAVLGAARAAEFLNRVAPADGPALIPTFKGKTLAWNQLMDKNRISASTTADGITFTNNGDGSVTVSGTATGNAAFQLDWRSTFFAGHTYLFSGCPSGGSSSTYKIYISGDYDYGAGCITTRSSGALNLLIQVSSGTVISSPIVFRPQIFDLTIMFGEGYEPSTVAEFRALYPAAYYAHNAGTLINNAAASIKTVGRNQWDEVWEVGSINNITGQDEANAGRIRSKNYIALLYGAIYYYKGPDTAGLRFYDADKNFLEAAGAGANSTFTPPSGAQFLRFTVLDTPTYAGNICINISDPAFNGQYAPYEGHTAPIGLDAFDAMDGDGNIVTFHGIEGVGTAYDEINGQKLTRRFGVVDLGSKNYTKSGIWFSSDLADAKRPTSSTGMPLAICARFNANTWQQANDGDFLIAYTGSGAVDNAILQIAASAYASVADFKAAMQGVYLVYELATPVEYTLIDPLGDTYQPTEGGTEEILADEIVAPFCADIRYKAEDESGIASSILAALKAAGKIASYSVTYDPATSQQVITVS